ncbi:plasmid mobilization protein [Dyadobacter sp. CY323]|uniref:plasmid mobilization protein n=1 Tax=Dyadobacter sp. CY323 TaxID=2907302 RepID=UPI001F30375F|nr:hypothetical protein [Dyadobacter sp. CY323]MCE6993194.1 hypothetical protein [Dyadobacter sp. CY323]
MARPTKPAAVKLSKLVQFRITETELLQLEEAAAASGMTIADLCRSRIIGSKPRRQPADPIRREQIAALGKLGNIRSDINQLLKDRWAYKYVTPEQVSKTFADLETAADAIQTALSNGN